MRLRERGLKNQDISNVVGVSVRTIQRWVHAWQDEVWKQEVEGGSYRMTSLGI